jgi:hypothetical protein
MFTPISKRLVAAVESATDPVSLGETAGPRGRPSWSGLLRLSLVTVPVKAYLAHRGAGATHFNQLHANCGQRIQHQKRCPVHGAVEAAEITHGFQYAPDQYVRVEPDEMERIRPPKDKALVLEQFIPMHGVDPVLFAGRSLTWSRTAWRRGIPTPWWLKPCARGTSGPWAESSCPSTASWC